MSDMQKKCILVIEEGSVINRALENIMADSKNEFTVVAYNARNVRELLSKSSLINPDVFFLGESTKLAAKNTLGYLLMNFPNVKVVIVSEGSNYLHVISKRDTLLTQRFDLIDAVLC
jgi:hypothetical protein